jgi:hypothetical protein
VWKRIHNFPHLPLLLHAVMEAPEHLRETLKSQAVQGTNVNDLLKEVKMVDFYNSGQMEDRAKKGKS